MSLEEFVASFAAQFHAPGAGQRAQLESLFHTLDDDNSGSLEFREYLLGLALVAEVQGGADAMDVIRFAFDALDQNGDGRLSRAEVQTVFHRAAPDITAQAIDNMFEAAGVARAGEISFLQLQAFVEAHPEFLKTFQTHFL